MPLEWSRLDNVEESAEVTAGATRGVEAAPATELELLRTVAGAALEFLASEPVVNQRSEKAQIRLEKALAEWSTTKTRRQATLGRVRGRRCEHCGIEIFFAQTRNHRWMPLETSQIAAEGIPQSWRYVVDLDAFTGDMTVRFDPAADGKVWVDHRMTCGAGPGPKTRTAALVRRWQANAERLDAQQDNVRRQLERMRARLQPPEEG